MYLEAEKDSISAQFVPLGQRRYEILPVDVTGANSPMSAILAALPPNTGRDIYRLILTGEGAAPDLRGLEQALAPRFYGLTLEDRTRLPQDLWQRREEDTLTGLFLQTMYEKCRENPDEPLYQLAARFGLAALEDGEDIAL